MGGLLIVLAATIAFLPLTDYTLPALTIFGTTLACGAIGFLDDFIKLRHQRSLGLRGPLEDAAAARDHRRGRRRGAPPAAVATTSSSRSSTSRSRSGRCWYVLLFLIIAGAANGVNLTDGLDGLAAGTSIIALSTLTAMAVTIYIRSRRRTARGSRTGSTSRSSARR